MTQKNSNKTIDIPSQSQLGKKIFLYGFLIPIFLLSVAFLLAPTDIFKSLPWTRTFADFIRDWIFSRYPSIDIYRKARSTGFPELAMLASAASIVLIPFFAIVTSLNSFVNFSQVRRLHSAATVKFSVRVACYAIPILGIFFLWAFLCLPGDYSFVKGFATHNKFGFLFLLIIVISFLGIGMSSFLLEIRTTLSKILGSQ